MDFCRFYGLSAPMILTLQLDNDTVSDMLKPLNHTLGLSVARDLMTEIDYIADFFESKVMHSYSSEDDGALYNQMRLNTRYRNGALELSEEQIMDDHTFYLVKSKLRFSSKLISRNVLVGKGRQLALDDNQFKVLQYIAMRLPVLKAYRETLDANRGSSGLSFFGLAWMQISNSKGKILFNHVHRELSFVRDNRGLYKKTLDLFKNDISILRQAVLTNTKNLAYPNVRHNDFDYVSAEEYDAFTRFVRSSKLLSNSPDMQKHCYDIIEYSKLITVDFFNSIFDLQIKSIEEYEELFETLDDLGVVGFNFHIRNFMEAFIESANSSQDDFVNITTGTELESNLVLLSRFLDSCMEVGDKIV